MKYHDKMKRSCEMWKITWMTNIICIFRTLCSHMVWKKKQESKRSGQH